MESLLAPTKDDMKSMSKREHRQRQEQVRRERIFNPRVRLIGIDKSALDQHVQEKQYQKLMEQNEEKCFALEQHRQTEAINSELNEVAEEQKRKQCELNEFRNKFQQKEQTRDFDLNDPNRLRKMCPSEGLDWLGVDPEYSHRIKLQREQQKSWLQQQIDEKNAIKKNMTEAKKAIETDVLNQDAQINEKAWNERQQRQKIQSETALYNFKLAQALRAKQMAEKRREEEDNLAEIMNNLSSDMLTESKDYGASSLWGEARVNTSMYRGMTDEQLLEIRHEQLRQIEEKKLNAEMMKKNEILFNENVKNHINSVELEERDVQNQRLQERAHQNSMNAQLLEEQKERNQFLNSKVYKFTPSEAYFDQFNTTSR